MVIPGRMTNFESSYDDHTVSDIKLTSIFAGLVYPRYAHTYL